MPWTAIYDGKERPPHDVPLNEEVECPTCGGRMAVWSRSSDGKARHFKHIANMGHGDGGGGVGGAACESVSESQEHKVWKSFAADTLLDAFEGNVSSYEGFEEDEKRELLEESGLDAPVSDKDWRVGDVVLTFDKKDRQLGEGVVVEVQHKNESKDIDVTTADYVEQGYSVVWLYQDDFAHNRCKLTEVDFRHRAFEAIWPEYVPRKDDWRESQYNHKTHLEEKWSDAKANGLVEYGSDATLPREWCDEQAREIWESQDWHILFPEFRESWQCYDTELYFREVKQSGNSRPEIPARLPNEWYDETSLEIWREQSWDSIFKPPKAKKYRLRDAVPDAPTPHIYRVNMPTPIVREWIYSNSDWESLFEAYEFEKIDFQYKKPTIDIDIAPFLSREFWQSWYLEGKDQQWGDRQSLDRPRGPFDDVQCHNCGNYQYSKNASETCDNCGVEYDWEWNLATDRISSTSIPERFREQILENDG